MTMAEGEGKAIMHTVVCLQLIPGGCQAGRDVPELGARCTMHQMRTTICLARGQSRRGRACTACRALVAWGRMREGMFSSVIPFGAKGSASSVALLLQERRRGRCIFCQMGCLERSAL